MSKMDPSTQILLDLPELKITVPNSNMMGAESRTSLDSGLSSASSGLSRQHTPSVPTGFRQTQDPPRYNNYLMNGLSRQHTPSVPTGFEQTPDPLCYNNYPMNGLSRLYTPSESLGFGPIQDPPRYNNYLEMKGPFLTETSTVPPKSETLSLSSSSYKELQNVSDSRQIVCYKLKTSSEMCIFESKGKKCPLFNILKQFQRVNPIQNIVNIPPSPKYKIITGCQGNFLAFFPTGDPTPKGRGGKKVAPHTLAAASYNGEDLYKPITAGNKFAQDTLAAASYVEGLHKPITAERFVQETKDKDLKPAYPTPEDLRLKSILLKVYREMDSSNNNLERRMSLIVKEYLKKVFDIEETIVGRLSAAGQAVAASNNPGKDDCNYFNIVNAVEVASRVQLEFDKIKKK